MRIKEAIFYKKREEEKVLCYLCPHHCLIPTGKSGLCQARINKNGVLYTENYAMVSALSVDPIEKKPLYHFYPGSKILSVGTFACNFKCDYCQNWQISQERPLLKKVLADDLIKIAKEKESPGIAYTYSEPSIWYEYVRETAEKAKNEGLKNVMISNGFISKEPLEGLIPFLDAVNLDLKSFNNDFYRKLCNGSLAPVLKNIELLLKNGIHIELTTLIITGYNDTIEEIRKLLSWVKHLNPDIPIHFSRYFPAHKMKESATPIDRMKNIFQIAKEYLNYVYIGNVQIEGGGNTICPECGFLLINRDNYMVYDFLKKNKCPECGHHIYGNFKI